LRDGKLLVTLFAIEALSLSACTRPNQRLNFMPAASHEDQERRLRILPPIELSERDDAIVRVVSDVNCSGVLIDDKLVLTAHHCVAERDSAGKPLHRDVDPSKVSVELGGDYLPWGEVGVRAIVSPDCGYVSGAGDIAILVLSRPLIGMPVHRVRIEAEPTAGEEVNPVGFGRCSLSKNAIKRVRRSGGTIDKVRLGEFVSAASICPGDSGGPVYSQASGEVVGVISASVMDGDERTPGLSVFTRLDVWRQLFSAAREIAAGASPSELPPYRSCSY
jgi:hypothetical protein